MKESKIIVLDFGSQYNQLIVRRIREMGVYSELLSHQIKAEDIRKDDSIIGIVFSGSPKSVYDADAFNIDPEIYNLNLPILGVCYGMQLTNKLLGGVVSKGTIREYGKNNIHIQTDSLLFKGLEKTETVWMSHGDFISKVPEGFQVDAVSENGIIASMSDPAKKIYCVQFHPEVQHSVHGNDMLHNFIYNICSVKKQWSMKNYIDMQVEKIRAKVGNKNVLCGLSGGVDSTVAAVLINKAIGSQLTCMFIDHGLLRKNEAEQVMETCKKFNINVIKVDAQERFLSKLEGVSEPEKKRKIIGSEFIYCFDEESKKIGTFDFLAQGTLYTDVIESGTSTAQTIKSHHNVGGLPKDMKFQLIEPLNVLFKDEVRALGHELGIADEIVWRQPFPGPGLAIRIVGEITKEKIKMVQDADAILREEIKKAGLDRDIWQYFVALSNMRSVGVMGDERTYFYAAVIRAVTSKDGMTADWARIPYDVLDTVSRRIVNEVKGINRVLLDCTSKPPATIELE